MDRKVYFGNATKQVWINAPQTGMAAGSQSYVSESQLLNGRAFVKRSRGSHRRFNATWLGSMNSSELENSLQAIKDFADGVYGDGPFYWIDPFAANQNILPPHWATPGLMQNDLPQIWDVAPFEYVATPSNTLNYPATSVRYVSAETDAVVGTKKLRLIIPEGYSLFFGWHGTRETGTNASIRIDRFLRSTGDAEALDTTPLAVTSSNRTNAIVNGTIYSHVEIYLYNPDGAGYDFTVSGMIAQILPSTSFPEQGSFVSGRGTTGLEFGGSVNIEYYSSNINDGQIGMSTDWVEV
jgi:hypothetical protein